MRMRRTATGCTREGPGEPRLGRPRCGRTGTEPAQTHDGRPRRIVLEGGGVRPHPRAGARLRAASGSSRMSTPELVTLTIDGREVSVPKGTGLVEAALAAG